MVCAPCRFEQEFGGPCRCKFISMYKLTTPGKDIQTAERYKIWYVKLNLINYQSTVFHDLKKTEQLVQKAPAT